MQSKNILSILAFSILAIGFNAHQAVALPEFKGAFKAKYADSHKSKDFQSAVKKAGCNVCHVKGSKIKKEVQNEYGKLLNKMIEGDAKERKSAAKAKDGLPGQNAEKAKILAELDAAFKKLETTKSAGGKGPTYGELINAGKLPVDIEQASKQYLAEVKKAAAEKPAE